MKKKQMNSFSIALLLFIAVFGITNIPANYASLGNSSIGWFIILSIYFIPLALLIGELNTQNIHSKSGMYGWIEIGLGKRGAFFGGWSYFIVNIFYLPMLASRIPVLLSWTFNPIKYDLNEVVVSGGNIPGILTASENQVQFLVLTFITFVIVLILGIYFEKFFSILAKTIGWLSLIITGLFIVMGLLGVILFGSEIANPITVQNSLPTINKSSITTFAWIVFAITGIETIGSYTPYIDNAKKKIPKAAVVSAILIIGTYVIGFITLSFILTPEQVPIQSLENMIPIMYAKVGDIWGLGGIFLRLITFSFFIITLTALVLWLIATVKSLFEEFPDGLVSEKIKNYQINGIPIFGLVITVLFVVVLLIISSVGNADNIYYTLYDMTTIAVLLPYLLIAASFLVFSIKNKNGFNVIKNKATSITIAVFVLITTLISMIFAIFDLTITDKKEFISWAITSSLGLIYFMLIGVGVYIMTKKRKTGLIFIAVLILTPFILILL